MTRISVTLPPMDDVDRDVLHRFAAGHRPRAIAVALDLEHSAVAETIRQLCDDDKAAAAEIVAAYDRQRGPKATDLDITLPEPSGPGQPADSAGDVFDPMPGRESIVAAATDTYGALAGPAPVEPEPATPPAAPSGSIVVPPEGAATYRALLLLADAEQRAVDGDRRELPRADGVDALLDAAEHVAGVPELAAMAREARAVLSRLASGYEQECRRRVLRAIVAEHRAGRDAALAELQALEGAAGPVADEVPAGLLEDRAVRDEIRRWAQRTGRPVAPRGIIAQTVVQQWWAAEGRDRYGAPTAA